MTSNPLLYYVVLTMCYICTSKLISVSSRSSQPVGADGYQMLCGNPTNVLER